MPATDRTIVFLSDFGYRNEWVGIYHAVMNRVAPRLCRGARGVAFWLQCRSLSPFRQVATTASEPVQFL